MISSIIYTNISKVDYSKSETLKISLIQHNLNCWLSQRNPNFMYVQAYNNLEGLSRVAESKDTDLVVWPETAFVPAIEWHKKYRPKNDRARYELIMRMEEYLRSTDAMYIIGNNESFNQSKIPDRDKQYNTAYLYNKDQITDKYRKIHLVPFTERFPYPEKFPWLFNYVKKLGAKQLAPGEEQTLFDIKGIKSTILICYEDVFTDLTRESVNNGSNLFINITNDAWTSSSSSPLQHLAAASLRTIENRRSLVRAGTSGFTGVIDPNGKILESLPLFTEGELTYNVPVYDGHKTIYTKYGNIIDNIGYLLFFLTLLLALFKTINERKKYS